jgi:tetratricopeptide (TPR) repeat protein
MRTDRWKLILAPRPELYDLENDPEEKQNVIDRNPAEADRLEKKIWEVVGPKSDEKLAFAPVDAQARQELAALGYVNPGTTREQILNAQGPDPKDRLETLSAMQQYEESMRKKSYAQAAQAMDKAVLKDPTNPLAYLYLGTASEKLNQWDRAIKSYRAAAENNVATDQIFSRLGMAYLRVSKPGLAVSAMEKAAGMNPANLDNLDDLGSAYLLIRQPDKAQKCFKALLAQDNSHAKAYNGLGLAAVQLHDRESALLSFQKAIELDPQEAEPLLHLGLLYQGSGDAEEARRYLKLFLERANPNRYGPLIAQIRKSVDQLNPAN